MGIPLIFNDVDLPPAITEAAMLVQNWMEQQGHRNWLLMGIASRSFCERLICEVANLKAEGAAAQKELDQINGQLIGILGEVKAANENMRRLQEEVINFQ